MEDIGSVGRDDNDKELVRQKQSDDIVFVPGIVLIAQIVLFFTISYSIAFPPTPHFSPAEDIGPYVHALSYIVGNFLVGLIGIMIWLSLRNKPVGSGYPRLFRTLMISSTLFISTITPLGLEFAVSKVFRLFQ